MNRDGSLHPLDAVRGRRQGLAQALNRVVSAGSATALPNACQLDGQMVGGHALNSTLQPGAPAQQPRAVAATALAKVCGARARAGDRHNRNAGGKRDFSRAQCVAPASTLFVVKSPCPRVACTGSGQSGPALAETSKKSEQRAPMTKATRPPERTPSQRATPFASATTNGHCPSRCTHVFHKR